MQATLSTGQRSAPSPRNRFLVAGVALTGAAVVAVNPVTPSLPTVPALNHVEHRAVQLAANPLSDLGTLISGTLSNVGLLGGEFVGTTTPAILQAAANPEIYADLVRFLGSNALNPLPLLQQIVGFNSTYGATIGASLKAGADALQLRLDQFPTVVTNTLNYLKTGQFLEAFSEVNVWSLVTIERALVPLLPTLAIPGNVLRSLPNGERLANVFDTLLKRGIFTEAFRAVLSPPITAMVQLTVVLDTVREAVVAGDAKTAISELVSLPVKVVNAFVNGFVPPFSSRSKFTGILGEGGSLDYLFNYVPKAIADAFNSPVVPAVTTAPTLAKVSSTSLDEADTAVTLSLNSADTQEVTGDAAAATDVASTEPALSATVPDVVVTPVESVDTTDSEEADNSSAAAVADEDQSGGDTGSSAPVAGDDTSTDEGSDSDVESATDTEAGADEPTEKKSTGTSTKSKSDDTSAESSSADESSKSDASAQKGSADKKSGGTTSAGGNDSGSGGSGSDD